MGAVCCCLHGEDFEEYVNPNNNAYRNCICLRCFVHNCFEAYTTLFQRGQVHAISSSAQGTASLTSTTSHDDSIPGTYTSPPRPLPYDADPRCYRLQRDGLVSRREKGSSHLHEESEPLRGSDTDAGLETSNAENKWNGSDEASLKHPSTKMASAVGYFYASSEDEDVCPTCLEEYTSENPKIMTKCSHHFHLGCIYEWMERSETCPVCGKVMVFDETT